MPDHGYEEAVYIVVSEYMGDLCRCEFRILELAPGLACWKGPWIVESAPWDAWQREGVDGTEGSMLK
jgi:hypothetical protein